MRSGVLILIFCLSTAAAGADGGYPDVEEVQRALAAAGPVVEIGKSGEGRSIGSVLLGLEGATPVGDRPRLLVVAGMQADRRVGTAVACALWPELLTRVREDPDLARALARYAVEIVPLANPDGLAALLAGPERRFPTNTRKVDLDRDGDADEDGPADLDCDGRITWIRVPRPGGSHGLSAEDPRLLVPAGQEQGVRGAFDLYPEGIDHDGDGAIGEDGRGGVDIDRNFPHGWVRDDAETGRSCPSEPESRALADHLLSTPRIACVLVFGSRDNLIEVPPQNTAEGRREPNGPLSGDIPWMRETVRRYRAVTGADAAASDAPDGAFHQWAYAQRGIPAFSTRVFFGPPPAEAGKAPPGAAPPSLEAKLLAWSDRELDGKGFAPWRPFRHPTLGAVEIGGFAPLIGVNPPASHLPDLVGKHARFVGELLSLLPSPVLAAPKATPVGRGLYELRVTLRNDGVFPVITEMGRQNGAPLPIRVELDLPAERVLTGGQQVRIDRLDGYGGRREVVWLIRGKPNDLVRIRAVVDTCGTLSAEVEL